MELTAVILIWVFLGIIGACVLDSSPFLGFLLGVLFGPLGWLVCFAIQNNANKEKDKDKEKYQDLKEELDRLKMKQMKDEIALLKKSSHCKIINEPREVRVTCPSCGQHLIIENPKHGENISCPTCNYNIYVL